MLVPPACGDLADLLAGLCAQNEKRNDELGQHPDDDGVPLDKLPVPRGSPQDKDRHGETEETDRAVFTRVVFALRTGECPYQDNCND